jgi:hypothetical protein
LNLGHFVEFCKQKFNLLGLAVSCRDPRKQPRIPMATVFLFAVMGLCLRKRSFLQMDLWARTPAARRLFGSKRRQVLSDASLWRIVPGMDLEQTRAMVRSTFIRWVQMDGFRLTLPSGRQVRAGIVDGTILSGFEASALQIKTDFGDFPLDLEVSRGRGFELETSEILLLRAREHFGPGFIDLLMGDGLYLTEPMLRLCRALGCHLLVKTTEVETLNILKDAKDLFASAEMRDRIEMVQGVDEDRGVRYVVKSAGGFRHGRFPGTLKVAYVEERLLKSTPHARKPEPYWVVTSDERLTAMDLRQLGHDRWSIENQLFKMLNEQMNSKHIWTRGAKSRETFQILMLLMFLAFAMLKTFEASQTEEELWAAFHLRSITLSFVVQALQQSHAEAPPLVVGTG